MKEKSGALIAFASAKFCPKMFLRWFGFAVLIAFLASCTATRFIPDDQLLLRNTVVELDEKPLNFTKSDLEYLIALKPNNKFLGNRIQLWFYYFSESRQNKRFWRWVHRNSGDAPVYVDKFQNQNTAQQLSRYVYNKGYFNNQVDFELQQRKSRLAAVNFKVQLGTPYIANEITQVISDSVLARFVDSIQPNTLLKTGAVYDAYLMDNERDRITNHLRDKGYFNFSKDFIFFNVDSSLSAHRYNLEMKIENPNSNSSSGLYHKRYFIKNVLVFPRHNPFVSHKNILDTTSIFLNGSKERRSSQVKFIADGDLKIKPTIFNNIIQIYQNEPFSINKLRLTYKGLTNLKIYRASNITFDTLLQTPVAMVSDTNWLNCNIYLQRSKVNAYSVDIEGTNSGGDLGIRGSLVFSNKNLFKGAEVLRLRLNGGFEAQKLNVELPEGSPAASIFNTREFGADASLYFPRFLSPIAFRAFAKEYQPKTNINIGFSDQRRQNYSRTVLKAAFGYDWMTKPTINHLFTIINLSSVKVSPSAAFQLFLNQQTNQRFKDQYSDHLIFSMKYSFIYNNQNMNKINDFVYYRLNVESSGNLLSLFNKTPLIKFNDEFHTLLGIRYAQYVRFDHDFRYYRLFTHEQRIVFRAMTGLGLPYGNSNEMPFERSFFAGGSNGMRGWQLRQLGPGSFTDTLRIERVGDIQLEFNVEYRFPIYSYLKGALFMDAGNIWTLKEKEYYRDGNFKLDRFYHDIALDAGIGLRFDFSFFIFRLDAAAPIRNPEQPLNQRWVLNRLQMKQLVWNFGIGYPF